MEIVFVPPVGFAANSYLLTADGRTAVAVDPARPRVLGEAKRRGLDVRFVLLTHCHFDHTGGCAALQAAGAKVGCLEKERELVYQKCDMGAEFGYKTAPYTVDFTFRGGEKLSLCGLEIEVLATPGHTAGSCCFRVENTLLSGDTLFAGDVGRTDLPTGDEEALKKSLRTLFALGGGPVLPGHGQSTELSRERKFYSHLL